MGKTVYFYANDEFMGSLRMNAYSARYVVREMNIRSTRIWRYEWEV